MKREYLAYYLHWFAIKERFELRIKNNIMCWVLLFEPELSVGLFSSTEPNPTHQITDPTQPNPLPGELMDP